MIHPAKLCWRQGSQSVRIAACAESAILFGMRPTFLGSLILITCIQLVGHSNSLSYCQSNWYLRDWPKEAISHRSCAYMPILSFYPGGLEQATPVGRALGESTIPLLSPSLGPTSVAWQNNRTGWWVGGVHGPIPFSSISHPAYLSTCTHTHRNIFHWVEQTLDELHLALSGR